jgi:hypothetical protein
VWLADRRRSFTVSDFSGCCRLLVVQRTIRVVLIMGGATAPFNKSEMRVWGVTNLI